MHDFAIDVAGWLPAVTVAERGGTLSARNLVYEAGGKRLIDGVNLSLRDRRVTAVMGPNGAGKSLLLRLLHGLLGPTHGEVLWQGCPLDDAIRRRQAMVFQRPVLLRRSVAANIRYSLQVHGLPSAECARRLEHVLGVAHLAHLADRPARVLSGGEQQRLALARALSTAPEILFLDEPTANLDPASTLAIEDLLRDAHARGTTIVLVTHDMGQTRRLAHDVVFMHHGRVAEHADADGFLERPQSVAARAFVEGRIVL